MGRSAAHIEHPAHVGDAGRVEAKLLVELLRVLCAEGRKQGRHCGLRGELCGLRSGAVRDHTVQAAFERGRDC